VFLNQYESRGTDSFQEKKIRSNDHAKSLKVVYPPQITVEIIHDVYRIEPRDVGTLDIIATKTMYPADGDEILITLTQRSQ